MSQPSEGMQYNRKLRFERRTPSSTLHTLITVNLHIQAGRISGQLIPK